VPKVPVLVESSAPGAGEAAKETTFGLSPPHAGVCRHCTWLFDGGANSPGPACVPGVAPDPIGRKELHTLKPKAFGCPKLR
jgi:hypothetical protein